MFTPYPTSLIHVVCNCTACRAEKKSKQSAHDSSEQVTTTAGTNKFLQTSRSKHNEIKYGAMGCKMHNEHESYFRVAPLDGIPFLSSFSKDEKKKLNPSEILLLQQLELFTISSELMKLSNMNNAPTQTVGIRCRNCIADKNGCCFIKLSSVSNMSQNLLLMANEHVKRCQFLTAKDLKVLEMHDGEEGRLANYCNWLAKLYSLKDSSIGGFDTGVVWGESPKLPKVYCYPAEIDISFCIEGSSQSAQL